MDSKLLSALSVVVVLVIVIPVLIVGWRRRLRRQGDIGALPTVPAETGTATLSEDLFYVATTRAEQPLERIAARGLTFRGRAVVTVTASGVVLEIAGSAPLFIAASAITGAGRATWTVDRVVEKDGLVFVRWHLNETLVDTYLRSADPAALVAALDSLTPKNPDTPATEGAA